MSFHANLYATTVQKTHFNQTLWKSFSFSNKCKPKQSFSSAYILLKHLSLSLSFSLSFSLPFSLTHTHPACKSHVSVTLDVIIFKVFFIKNYIKIIFLYFKNYF